MCCLISIYALAVGASSQSPSLGRVIALSYIWAEGVLAGLFAQSNFILKGVLLI